MAKQKFVGQIGRSLAETKFVYENVLPKYGKNAPNVLYIVLDDLGFSDLGCFGSEIDTPNLDRIAKEGLRFNNFHTTAICSATRASLLSGANHHAVGVGTLVDMKTGCPNGIGHIDNSYATIAEVLHEYDYRTFAVGKWHVSDEMVQSGSYEQWPLQRGFDRYYGFLTACTDQFHPPLVQDNSYIAAPNTPDYHLSPDLTDRAIQYIYTSKMEHPDIPVFLYLAYGAMHSPHHVPLSYADRYKGKYDEGWDVIRKRRFEKQKELGVIPQNAQLTDRNELVKAWDDLSENEKKVYARQMEVYAGFLTHTDEQIGRVINFLEEIEQLDNTIIMFISDNGASSEGGQSGSLNQMYHASYIMEGQDFVDQEVERSLEHFDEIGTEKAYSHYSIGWANVSNTPFRWYKQWSYEGGTKDPLIVRYPELVKDAGSVREQYVHVSDLSPTVLDILGLEKPSHVKGVPQKPMTGVSFRNAIIDGYSESAKHVQYYEMMGNRAIYKDGWKATANHAFHESYDDDVWELYHVDNDYSEKDDVAEKYPEKLQELIETWFMEAGKNNVYPMPNVLALTHRLNEHMALQQTKEYPAETITYRNVIYPYQVAKTFRIKRNSFAITVKVKRNSESEDGVLLCYGDRFVGFSFFVLKNRVHALFIPGDYHDVDIVSDIELPVGESEIKLVALHNKNTQEKTVTININGSEVGRKKLHFDAKWFPRLYLGSDPYSPMSSLYEVPFAFKGKILELTIHTAPSEIDALEELEAYFSED